MQSLRADPHIIAKNTYISMEDFATKWPEEFTRRMESWLGEEARDFFEALEKRDDGLRLNPARGSITALNEAIPWHTSPVPWCPEGLWLQEDAALSKHPYHTTGVFYIQDPSAMAAAVLLDPKPGEWILDIAAAPGGKATQLQRACWVRASLWRMILYGAELLSWQKTWSGWG